MELIKKLSLVLLLAAGCQITATAQNRNPHKGTVIDKAYIFGLVASFNDSTIYITNIQELENVTTMMKKRLLDNKSMYTYQLREYFTNTRQLPHRTCVVFYASSRKKIDKKYEKNKKMYITKNPGKYDVRLISDDDFQFKIPEL